MQSSRRNNPCPICGRIKDGDCRFTNDLILCHHGKSHYPPQNLRCGDVLQVQGREWAFIKSNGGFDGGAAVFKPHRPRPNRKQFSPSLHVDQDAKRRNLINAQKKLIERFLNVAQDALDVLDFENAPPDELKTSFELIEKSYFQGKEIREIVGFCPELKNRISLIDKANKQLNYQYKDQLSFRRNLLGEDL